jgi:dihydroorotase
MNSQVMRHAMEYARDHGLVVVDHCQDTHLSAGGVMNEGEVSTLLGLKGMSHAAEESHVARDIMLAELTGARVHIAHLSTAGAIELVRGAKSRGLAVTCEVAPHHFTLTDRAVEGYDTNTKMAPPLRSEEHLEAILEGLRDGTIDAIATDHAPHHQDEKALEYDRAPFGITGLETAIGLAMTRLVHKGIIDLARLVELCSTNPAKIFRLKDRGTLKPGSIADVTIIDPGLAWTYRNSDSRSKSRNSPYDGWEFTGRSVATIVGGNFVYRAERGASA